MLSIHLLVTDDLETVGTTLDSIQDHLPTASYEILVGDLGSTDGTAELCYERGCHVHKLTLSNGLGHARNALVALSQHEWQFYLEPWETLLKGHDFLYHRTQGPAPPMMFQVVKNGAVSKQPRLWTKGQGKFVNPVFERLDVKAQDLGGVIAVGTRRSKGKEVELIQDWIDHSPTDASPHYYKACMLLGQRRWTEFESAAQAYLFREDPKEIMPVTMTRYYLGNIQCYVRKDASKAIQNVLSCIAARPLMAEFWCLLGDVHYHLMRKYEKALIFYRNALDLGKMRLTGDDWPMELAKYRDYPNKMIESCENIMRHTTVIRQT
jgi:glycosyltransferase involved in cell wall biosynthesis